MPPLVKGDIFVGRKSLTFIYINEDGGWGESILKVRMPTLPSAFFLFRIILLFGTASGDNSVISSE